MERAALTALRSLLSTLAGMSSEEIAREDFVRVFLRALRHPRPHAPRKRRGAVPRQRCPAPRLRPCLLRRD